MYHYFYFRGRKRSECMSRSCIGRIRELGLHHHIAHSNQKLNQQIYLKRWRTWEYIQVEPWMFRRLHWDVRIRKSVGRYHVTHSAKFANQTNTRFTSFKREALFFKLLMSPKHRDTTSGHLRTGSEDILDCYFTWVPITNTSCRLTRGTLFFFVFTVPQCLALVMFSDDREQAMAAIIQSSRCYGLCSLIDPITKMACTLHNHNPAWYHASGICLVQISSVLWRPTEGRLKAL